jgi:predicted nuclease with RNAse H fold
VSGLTLRCSPATMRALLLVRRYQAHGPMTIETHPDQTEAVMVDASGTVLPVDPPASRLVTS